MSQKTQTQKFFLECPECRSRFYSEPLTFGVRSGALIKLHPICPNCFSKCPLGHKFGYGELCDICQAPRRRFNLIRHEIDTGDPTFGNTSTGGTNYPENTQSISSNSANINFNGTVYAFSIVVTDPGTVTKVAFYVALTPSGNGMTAIYADSSGPSGDPLGSAPSTALVSGWNDFVLSTPVYVTSGTTYWLALQVDNSTAKLGENTLSTTRYYKSQGYGTWPNSGWTSQTGSYIVAYMRITQVKIKNYAKATKATLSESATYVDSMSFYSHATGNFRIAIYNDSSGPSSKQWESGSVAASASAWNTVNISSGTPTSLSLTAGTYWFAWQWDSVNAGPSYTAGTAGDGNWIQQTYAAFPATWSGGSSSAETWSLYVTYTIVALEQIHYRWYENDAAESPTARAAEDTLTDLVQSAGVLRLRVSVKLQTGSLSGWTFKLQYATSTSGPWSDVGAQGGGVIWRYYNGLGTDQNQVANALLTGTTIRQHFVEAAPSATNIDMGALDFGEWDYCIENNSAAGGTLYYFRVVKNDGTPLAYYTVYPTLTTYPSFIDYGSMIQYDPTKYSGAVTVYFEAQIKTNDSVRKAYARLWNIGDNQAVTGSLVSTTSTSYSRQRTGSLSLPGAAKEFKAQVGALQNMTASIKGARLVVDVS